MTYLRKNPEKTQRDLYYTKIIEPRYFFGEIEFKVLDCFTGESTYMYVNEKDFKHPFMYLNEGDFDDFPDM